MEHGTREQWLEAAVQELTPMFDALPNVRVSCGWPMRGGASTRRRTIGSCHLAKTTGDKRPHIFISPVVADPVEVLDVLAHELCHAVVDVPGHRGPFVKLARKIGLEGPPTSTHAGATLLARLNAVAGTLGDYPHAALTPASPKIGAGSRLRLYECACGVKVRVASDEFEATCRACGGDFEKPEEKER